MHAKDDLLVAYRDDQLDPPQAARVREHLSRCPDCTRRYTVLRQRAQTLHTRLDALSPVGREIPRSTATAYQRIFARKDNQRIPMNTTRRPLWAALTIVLALTLAFSLPPVRAWASGLLGLFRVEQVAVITFDPANLRAAKENLSGQQAAIEAIFQDNLTISDEAPMQPVDSAAAAAEQLGFTPRLPQPENGAAAAPRLFVRPGMEAVLTIDQPKMQAIFDAAQVDVDLPVGVDGEKITLTTGSALIAAYGEACPASLEEETQLNGCTVLLQMPSPEVTAPEGIDVARMGQAMFQFLGLSEADARAMAERIDWTTTLVLPIPQDEAITSQDVNVDGVKGVLLHGNEANAYSLIWVKDGVLYMLNGVGGAPNALPLANSMQ